MLSKRAQQYLATFERRPSVPLEEVKRRFAERGQPCSDAWLSFHERYAGLKGESSRGYVLGLVQPVEASHPAYAPRVEGSDWEGPYCDVMICVVEPGDSDLELDWHGRYKFSGQRADSFDRLIERDALLWEFEAKSKTRYVADDELCQGLLPQLETDWIAEASDEYVDCYRSSRYLLFVNARTGYVDDVYECVDEVLPTYESSGGRKPAPLPAPEGAPAFLPLSILHPPPLSDDPYRRLVERLSLFGNLASWDPRSIARALGGELEPGDGDPSWEDRHYWVNNSDVFSEISFDLPTHRSYQDFTFSLTPQALYATEPSVALAPILPSDSRTEVVWPEKQAGKTPKRQCRDAKIGDIEIQFAFEGEDFTGPQRLTSIYITRPDKWVASTHFAPDKHRVESLSDAEYSIRRRDDDSEAVRVVHIIEDPSQPDRIFIGFRCLDRRLTLHDGDHLITTLIVQGLHRERFGRVEHLNYKEVDSEVEYTRPAKLASR
ncbi:MAG: hypothetical protein ACOY0T_19615 [Myxococcota bacterium]